MQQRLRERASMLSHSYIACLVIISSNSSFFQNARTEREVLLLPGSPIFSSSVTSITWQYAKLYLPDSRGHGQCYVNRGLEEDLMMLSIWMNSLKTSCSRRTYSSDEGPDTTAHLSLNKRLMFSWHERYNIQHASAEVYLLARHCA